MNVIPQLKADMDEYPELGKLIGAVVRNVVEIMQVHDIGAVRRFRKEGVFDRPYVKDVVTPLGVRGVPAAVAAARDAAGSALLDYLEAVGMTGIGITATDDEKGEVAALWSPANKHPEKADAERKQTAVDDKDPVMVGKPAEDGDKDRKAEASVTKKQDNAKEKKNGKQP